MSDESGPSGPVGEQRELLARLRAVAGARDAENAMLRVELAAALDRERRLELRVAELERRLGMDSSNSGTPSSKECPVVPHPTSVAHTAQACIVSGRTEDGRLPG